MLQVITGVNVPALNWVWSCENSYNGCASIHHRCLLLVSMMCFNSVATPTNGGDYNCHIKAIELLKSIIWGHITPHHAANYY